MTDPRIIRAVYINYLRVKAEIEDWHAVSDIANDLRVLDAEIALRFPRPQHLEVQSNDPAKPSGP